MTWTWRGAGCPQTRIIVVIRCLKAWLIGVAVGASLALSSVRCGGFGAMGAGAYTRLTSPFVGGHGVRR